MQADRPSSRLSAAPPAHDQAGPPRNRQSRSAARVHPPWLRVPSGAHPHRRTPSDLASPNPRFATPKGIIIARKQRGSWRRPTASAEQDEAKSAPTKGGYEFTDTAS